jgi:hypothetical protein
MNFKYLTAVCAVAGALAVVAPAQDANRTIIDTRTDVRTIVKTLTSHTNEFKDEFEDAVDDSILDDTRLEDRAKRRADDLHDQAKKLADVFEDKRDKNHPKVREQVDRVLAVAGDVNGIMRQHRFTDKLQRQWGLLRGDLNALAAVYDLAPL